MNRRSFFGFLATPFVAAWGKLWSSPARDRMGGPVDWDRIKRERANLCAGPPVIVDELSEEIANLRVELLESLAPTALPLEELLPSEYPLTATELTMRQEEEWLREHPLRRRAIAEEMGSVGLPTYDLM